MGDAFFTVREVSTKFIDPVVEQLMYSLMNRFGLRDFFNNCYYVFNGRTAVSKSDDTQGNMRMGNNRCDVTIETHLNPSVQMWERMMDYNTPSVGTSKLWTDRYEKIWGDDPVGVSLVEYTVPFGVTMNVALTFKSFDSAQMALDRITAQSSGDVVNQMHDIVYSYPIELSVMGLMGRIYDARKSLNQTMTFYQYVQACMRAQMSVEVNKYDVGNSDPAIEYVIRKTQLSCLALLQCDQESPEATMQDDIADAWVINFTYKFQSGRPHTLKMSYPPVIEQTVLPNIMFQKTPVSWFDKVAGSYQNQTFQRAFLNFSDIQTETKVVFRFPKYDDWNLPKGILIDRFGYDPLMVGIVTTDDDQTGRMSFNQLGNVQLHPFVCEILGKHSSTDIIGMNGLYNVCVFVDDIQLDPSLVTWDPETLTVSFLADRPTCIYRVVLSEAGNVRVLDPKWFPTILEHRYFYPMTICRNLDYFVKMGYYVVTGDNALINLMKTLIKTDRLQYYLDKLVSGGYTSGEIYRYTQTSTQIADYISNTRARLDRNTSDDTSFYSKTVFDVLMDFLQADGVITAATRPTAYIETARGFPYGSGPSGYLKFNIPLRIEAADITVAHRS